MHIIYNLLDSVVYIDTSATANSAKNVISFENCTFIRNKARMYGAAIGETKLLYFRDISNISPFQIINW